ncbi:MAG: hypothetical protein IPI46_01845 [Bacteroidetes bacterium]|nr:hypothetical protein [Bacteroidota bacterium]
MKKIIALLSLLFIVIQIAAQENKNVIAIGFYNLENFYDTINDPNKLDDEFTPNGPNAYTPAVFWKKIENLSEVISKMGTDKSKEGIELLGVAEVENQDVLVALCNSPKLKNKHYKSVIFDGPDERSIDCGLLYNPKFFKVLQAKSLTVPFPEGDRPTRDVLYVTGKFHGEVVHIFVNHWPSRRGGEAASRPKRKLAASVSKQVIDSLMKLDPLSKVIVMGDLNDDPIDESVVKVLGAKSKLEDTKSGQLYNPFTAFYKKGIGTLAYQDAWGLFDQIIISYGLASDKTSKLQFQEAQVFNRRFLIQKDGQYQGYPHRSYIGSTWNDGYSDHFPTVIFFNAP